MSGAHLDDWQRRSFDISSGACTPEQTADAYRAHILSIQYAWASSQLSQAAFDSLLRTYSERYAAVLDSDDPRSGLNNYAESALHLARSQRNHSNEWESSLTRANVLELPCVQKMLQVGTGGVKSLVAPADVNISVGQESRSSYQFLPSTGVEPLHPLFKSTGPQLPKAEDSSTFSNPLGGAAERQRGFDRISGNPSASACPPVQPQTLFSPAPLQVTSGAPAGSHSHQPIFFPASNPSKRDRKSVV